jgi:hypothetical protein
VWKFSYHGFMNVYAVLSNSGTLMSKLLKYYLQHSWNSNWLWAGQLRAQSSTPDRVKNFFFSTSSRPALGSTRPPIKCVPEVLSPGGKAAGASI